MNILSLWCGLLLLSLLGCKKPEGYEYGHFERVGDLNIARARHTATLLQDGRVLIAGGETALPHKGLGSSSQNVKELEIYDPKTQKFRIITRLHEGHIMPEAPLLPDGRVVFIGAPGRHAEIYDPKTNQVVLSEQIVSPLIWHTVTGLKDGRVLFTGGEDIEAFSHSQGRLVTPFRDTGEIFDPVTGRLSFAGKMHSQRVRSNSLLLPNGNVLITGGDGCSLTKKTQTAEVYHLELKTFELLRLNLNCRTDAKILALSDAKILLFEGYAVALRPVPLEVISRDLKSIYVSHVKATGRGRPAIALLKNNRVLITGGFSNGFGENSFLASTLIYEPRNDLLLNGPNMLIGRLDNTATTLKDGTVLITGGSIANQYIKTAERFINESRTK